MKISNFNLIERNGTSYSDYTFKATVEVETGFIFKKKVRRTIYKEFAKYWVFADTGEYTPDFEAEKAQKVYEAEYGSIIYAEINLQTGE